jgi:hypothetical protein
LGDGNSKQWKLYNWLNIVNIFKKRWTIHLKNAKLSVQPNILPLVSSFCAWSPYVVVRVTF